MKIIDVFKKEWPGLAEQMVMWTPCGIGRIRVKLKNRSYYDDDIRPAYRKYYREVIFTYYDDDTWSLETEKYNRKWRK